MLHKRIFYTPFRKVNKCLSAGGHFSTSSTYKEAKIKIRNYEINYLRVGRGAHHVFCAPGAMGTIWSDYRKQIEGFDLNKFSLILWDPPGFGKSIALDNKEASDMLLIEADFAYEFLKALQIPRLSGLGWSYGGIVCLLLASRYPDIVNKVVVCGCNSFYTSREIERIKAKRNLNSWSQSTIEALFQLYGKENFLRKLDKSIESRVEFYNSKKSFCDEFRCVKCPTLLLHGAKDQVVDFQHLEYLKDLIPKSRTYLYPEAGHDVHIHYSDDFNKRVQEFLLEPNENEK